MAPRHRPTGSNAGSPVVRKRRPTELGPMRATLHLPLVLVLVLAACAPRRPAVPAPDPAPRASGIPASVPAVGVVLREPRAGKPVTTRSLIGVGLDPEAL